MKLILLFSLIAGFVKADEIYKCKGKFSHNIYLIDVIEQRLLIKSPEGKILQELKNINNDGYYLYISGVSGRSNFPKKDSLIVNVPYRKVEVTLNRSTIFTLYRIAIYQDFIAEYSPENGDDKESMEFCEELSE